MGSVNAPNSLKDKIMGNINAVVNEVFTNYFGISVRADNKSEIAGVKSCLCQVHLKQDGVNMFVCFNFDASLLCSLVDETYSGEIIKNAEPYKDAACEIANIVCCRVKAMLNDNGYKLDMDIPAPIDLNRKNSIQYKDVITMHFSTNNDSGFFVDLFASERLQ